MASGRLTALLGLLAVAGYQNRHRLSELFSQLNLGKRLGIEGQRTDVLHQVQGQETGRDVGLLGGLGELMDRLKGEGERDIAKSWVDTGPNRDIEVRQLEQALGEDAIKSLTQETGLSRDELLSRLKAVLPSAVDKLTPEGRLPSET